MKRLIILLFAAVLGTGMLYAGVQAVNNNSVNRVADGTQPSPPPSPPTASSLNS